MTVTVLRPWKRRLAAPSPWAWGLFLLQNILLIATGVSKAHAVHRMFDCRQGPSVPASQLLKHPNLTVIVDEDAASQIAKLPKDVVYVK